MRGTLYGLIAFALTSSIDAAAGELQTFTGCKLVVTEWADGDSFQVEFPDGEERTLRLYGADCIEWHVSDDSDARRLRAQRRYFGISGSGGSPEKSIEAAKKIGEAATFKVRQLLEKKFTVVTAFADARGDGKFERYYAFVQLGDGRDLAEVLVESGLARAYGVYRSRAGGPTGEEYRERLKDIELTAAKLGAGVWQDTDWQTLPKERMLERDEEAALAAAKDGSANLERNSVDPNSAARDLLMKLPGIGETIANRVIEGRASGAYGRAEELGRVPGIGEKTIERIRPYLRFGDAK